MAIYSNGGVKITITSARLIPVWVQRTPGRLDWDYQPPKPTRGAEIEEMPIWFYQGAYADSGRPVCDGKWCNSGLLRADNGFQEIQAELDRLNPDHAAKWHEWNKADAPDASHFFPPVAPSDIA